MGKLIIYCEHIKGFINVVFVVNFCHLAILFFKNKTFVLVLIFSTTFSPFFVVNTKQLLWHPWSMTKQIEWSQCEMQWNMPFIPITPNFCETWNFKQVIWTLKSIHISILKILILSGKFIVHFEDFYLSMKVQISILKIIISI